MQVGINNVMARFSIRFASDNARKVNDGSPIEKTIGMGMSEEQAKESEKNAAYSRAEIFLEILVTRLGVPPEIKNNLSQKKFLAERGIEVDLPDGPFSVLSCDRENWRKKGLYYKDILIASGALGETTQLNFDALASINVHSNEGVCVVEQQTQSKKSSSFSSSSASLFSQHCQAEVNDGNYEEYDETLVF